MKKFKILSLDGGGSWALIQIRCLQKIYDDKNISGHKVLQDFDLVIANSGGSLALAAMAEGYTLEEIANIFLSESERSKVFSKLGFLEEGLISKTMGLCKIGPKYSAKRKLIGLKSLLPKISEKEIYEIPEFVGNKDLKIVVCTFDYERNRAVFIRSDKNSICDTRKLAERWGKPTTSKFISCSLTEAVHGASNAPVNYFDGPARVTMRDEAKKKLKHESLFWDGAVGGNNNPVLPGVIEAISNGVHPENIHVLSIGTANVLLPLDNEPDNPLKAADKILIQKPEKKSFKDDLLQMTTSILSDPPDSASFIAYMMLNPTLDPVKKTCFVRMNPMIQPVYDPNDHINWKFPQGIDRDDFKRLFDLDMDATKQKDVKLIDKFCLAYIEGNVPNQPVRVGGNMQPVIGQHNFSAALSEWQKWQTVSNEIA